MSEMLRSPAWNQKKCGAFYANVLWSNISSRNGFHKHTEHIEPNLYDYSCDKDSWGIAMSKV